MAAKNVLSKGLLMTVGAMIAIFAGARPPRDEKIVIAEAFHLVSKDGTLLAVLGASEKGHASLSLYHKDDPQNSEIHLGFSDAEGKPRLDFLGKKGIAISLALLADDVPSVEIGDADSQKVSLGRIPGDGVSLLFLDGKQKEKMWIGVNEKGEPQIMTPDKMGELVPLNLPKPQ